MNTPEQNLIEREQGLRAKNKSLYHYFHARLKKYKKSGKCEFCGKRPKTRTEFALKKGRQYSENRKDYLELCCPCHRVYDYKIQRKIVQRKFDGTLVKVRRSINSVKSKYTPSTVYYACIGKIKQAYGYKWEFSK